MSDILEMIVKFIFLIFIIFETSKARASSSCSSVRLDEPGGPFFVIPVYNQKKFADDDPGICYAVTASQLIDADRFFKKGKESSMKITSPLSIAIEYYKNREKNMFSGSSEENRISLGDTLEAISIVQNKEVCDQHQLEDFVSFFASNEKKQTVLPDRYRSLKSFVKETVKQVNQLADVKNFLIKQGDTLGTSNEPCLTEYFHILTSGQSGNLESIRLALLKALEQEDLVNQLSTVLGSICSENTFSIHTGTPIEFDGATKEENQAWESLWDKLPSEPENVDENIARLRKMTEHTNSMKPKRFSEKLSQVYSSLSPVPVAVSFSYSMISSLGNGNHVATIIGREFNSDTKKCEYIIRDSYGTDCNNGYKFKCSNGSIWVPEEILINSATELTWIPR